MTEPTAATEDQTGLVCPECGYDLRGIDSGQCPECGLAIDRAGMSVARIPWSHRDSIGAFKAYWRTSLLVIFRPRRLAEEVARPVSFADAQRFRLVTVCLAWLTVVAACTVFLITKRESAFDALDRQGSHLGWWMEAVVVAAAICASWLALFMISGVGSYFFHPGRLPVVAQNRAVALSYYASAPLAWLWLPALCAGAAAALSPLDWVRNGPGEAWVNALDVAAATIGGAIVLSCWFGVVRLMTRVTHSGVGRTTAMAVYLPFAWAVCTAVAALIPATALYLSLIVLSFH